MDTLTQQQLEQLVDANKGASEGANDSANEGPQGGALLSLYMPTERAGSEVRQNRIRFKNLIDEARQAVQATNGDAAKLEKQLDEIAAWEGDDDWWQHQSDALAIFLDGEKLRRWRLPLEVPTLCACSSRYHIRPLARLLQDDGKFYLLAVSMNDVRLFLGSKTSITELEDAQLPSDLRSALNIDEYVSTLQHHSTDRAGGDAMFHGHGGSDPDVKKQDEIKQYFRHIASALNGYFGVERRPLVFAGVQYLFPLFKQACDNRHLVDEPVTGNPDDQSGEELHGQAWPLVEKRFEAKRAELLEQFGAAAARDLGSDDLPTILTAAQRGQVATLLVSQGEHEWKTDPSTGDTAGNAAAADQINTAVVETLRTGGEVYAVAEGKLSSSAAAIFRYPLS